MQQTNIQKTINRATSNLGKENTPCYETLSRNETTFFFLGNPSLRSIWVVENVQLEFGFFQRIGASFENETIEAKFKFEILVGNKPIAITRIKLPKLTGKSVSLTSEMKMYVLELTTPSSFSNAEPLELAIQQEQNSKEPNSEKSQFQTVLLTNPRVIVDLGIDYSRIPSATQS